MVLGESARGRMSRALAATRDVASVRDERAEDPRIDDTDDQSTQCAPSAVSAQTSAERTLNKVWTDALAAVVDAHVKPQRQW